MHGARYQTIDLTQVQHHGTQHDGVFELFMGLQFIELAFTALNHRFDVLVNQILWVKNLQAFR